MRRWRRGGAGVGARPAELTERALAVHSAGDRPQTRRDRDAGNGMTVSVGRVRACPVLDLRLVALSHNTIRGAAGGAILNAELLVAAGVVAVWRRYARRAFVSAHAVPSAVQGRYARRAFVSGTWCRPQSRAATRGGRLFLGNAVPGPQSSAATRGSGRGRAPAPATPAPGTLSLDPECERVPVRVARCHGPARCARGVHPHPARAGHPLPRCGRGAGAPAMWGWDARHARKTMTTGGRAASYIPLLLYCGRGRPHTRDLGMGRAARAEDHDNGRWAARPHSFGVQGQGPCRGSRGEQPLAPAARSGTHAKASTAVPKLGSPAVQVGTGLPAARSGTYIGSGTAA